MALNPARILRMERFGHMIEIDVVHNYSDFHHTPLATELMTDQSKRQGTRNYWG